MRKKRRISVSCSFYLGIVLLYLLFADCRVGYAQTGSREFASAQKAIAWAQVNRGSAAEITHITITGNNDESDLLKLSVLNNNAGNGLFKSLESLDLPSQTGTIPGSCFYTRYTGCQWLKRFSAPGLTGIGSWAFRFCAALSVVDLPSVTHIGAFAFYNSGLTEIHLPASLERMDSNPFLGCQNLTSITIDGENGHFLVKDNVLYNAGGSRLIAYGGGRNKSSFTASDLVTEIESNAFGVCSGLSEVDLPAVTGIDSWAFEHCSGLQTLKLKSVNAINLGSDAFADVATSSVQLHLNAEGEEYTHHVSGNTWKELNWKGISGEFSADIPAVEPVSVFFFPNPVRDILYIKSDEPVGNIAIYDVNARLVLQTGYTDNGIDMTALSEGVYIARVNTAMGKKEIRLVKTR